MGVSGTIGIGVCLCGSCGTGLEGRLGGRTEHLGHAEFLLADVDILAGLGKILQLLGGEEKNQALDRNDLLVQLPRYVVTGGGSLALLGLVPTVAVLTTPWSSGWPFNTFPYL